MRQLRFLAIAVISFVAALFGALLSPSTWLHKSLSVALCGVLSANPALCTNNAIAQSQEASATNPVKVEIPIPNILNPLIVDRASEFLDNAPSNTLRDDFSDRGDLQKAFDEIQNDPVMANILGDAPLQLCQMTQTVINYHREASEVLPVYNSSVSPNRIAGEAVKDKVLDVTRINKIRETLELMNNLAKRENLRSFLEGKIKDKLQSMVTDAIDGKIKTDLDCSKYTYASEQNIDVCKLCKYEGRYRYPKFSGEYKATFDAPCEASLRQKIGYINRRLAEMTDARSPYGAPLVSGIPEQITRLDPHTCANPLGTQTAIKNSVNEVTSLLKVCAVPAEFWNSGKRQIGPVNMKETTCIVPGRVMTNEGEVDGGEWVGVCSKTGNNTFGQLPNKRPRSQPEDPARRNQVPDCPANWGK